MNNAVLITGAYGGLGTAMAHVFAREGHNLILLGRSLDKLLALKQNLAVYPVPCTTMVADVSNLEACKQVAEQVKGKVKVLINNAAISYIEPLGSAYDLSRFDALIATNLNGNVYLTQLLLSDLIQNKGSIVVISSVLGYAPVIGRTAYAASKYGLEGFYSVLDAELNDSVHILMVYPTFIDTNIRNNKGDKTINEVLSPALVAEAIYKSLKSKTKKIYLGKTAKFVYYLNKFLPRLYVRLMRNKIQKNGNG